MHRQTHTHSFVVAIALLRYGHIIRELSQLANVIVAGLIEWLVYSARGTSGPAG